MHRYVKYWNPQTESFQDGFLIKEQGNHFYLAYPIQYLWYAYQENVHRIAEKDLLVLEKDYYPYTEMVFQNPYEGDEWVFSFPYESYPHVSFQSIANFFEHFLYEKNRSFEERLEDALLKTRFFLSSDVSDHLSLFVTQHQNLKSMK